MAMDSYGIIGHYTDGKMSARPEYYAGRGNTLSDLDTEKLELIYNGVKKENGEKAAQAFVQMVSDMHTDASATTFLIGLHNLSRNNWEYSEQLLPASKKDATAQALADGARSGGSEYAASMGTAVFGAIFSSNAGPGNFGDGFTIIGHFLQRHSNELNDRRKSFVKDPENGFGSVRHGRHRVYNI